MRRHPPTLAATRRHPPALAATRRPSAQATGEAPPPMRSGASDEEWQAHQAYATRFYSTPAARALYYRYVRMLASRLNSCSGRRYADDPTILAWELANEARCARDVPEMCPRVPESTREYPTTLAWGLANEARCGRDCPAQELSRRWRRP